MTEMRTPAGVIIPDFTPKPNYRAIWDYDAQPKETVSECNLCGSTAWGSLLGGGDRYGFSAVWRNCGGCGLSYLSPRMTREAYARFYETAYRPLVSAFHGREINAQTIQPEQREYGFRLARLLTPYKADYRWRLLDIGGSTGIVAAQVAEALEMRAWVMEPSPEVVQALDRVNGVIRCAIEDFEKRPDEAFDLITLCQTADHLLDLMGSLKKIKTLLSPDGLFWSDIVDFNVTREVKIDHPFNLTERTYRQFLLKAGFSLLQVNYQPDGKHIGFLCR